VFVEGLVDDLSARAPGKVQDLVLKKGLKKWEQRE